MKKPRFLSQINFFLHHSLNCHLKMYALNVQKLFISFRKNCWCNNDLSWKFKFFRKKKSFLGSVLQSEIPLACYYTCKMFCLCQKLNLNAFFIQAFTNNYHNLLLDGNFINMYLFIFRYFGLNNNLKQSSLFFFTEKGFRNQHNWTH